MNHRQSIFLWWDCSFFKLHSRFLYFSGAVQSRCQRSRIYSGVKIDKRPADAPPHPAAPRLPCPQPPQSDLGRTTTSLPSNLQPDQWLHKLCESLSRPGAPLTRLVAVSAVTAMALNGNYSTQAQDQGRFIIAKIKTLTVAELKSLLRGLGLAVSGVKTELQLRAIASMWSEANGCPPK